jgi:multimeric flavodoxin WrbA
MLLPNLCYTHQKTMMAKFDFSELKAIYFNCTLKKSDRMSHTRGLINLSRQIMDREGVQTEVIRMVDHEVATGVYPDMTEYGYEKDEWPELFQRIIEADILVIGSPIWLGEPSSEARKLIERLYSMSGNYNDKGQYLYYGKAGGCILTGNEDGAKHCAMNLLYALQHIGYSIPPQADCGWLGEIGPGPSYLDDSSGGPENEFTNRNTTFMTYNLLHLALMQKNNGGYPAYGNSGKAWNKGERWKFSPIP